MNTSKAKLWGILLAILMAGSVHQAASADGPKSRQDFVIFGDSLSDTGNRFFDTGSMNTPGYEFVASQNLIPSLP